MILGLKEQTLENGKIKVVSFKKLRCADFSLFANSQKELEELSVVFGEDGTAYMNLDDEFCEIITESFCKLVRLRERELKEQKARLINFFGGDLPDDALLKMEEGRRAKALYLFFIKAELKRRMIEKMYRKSMSRGKFFFKR